ncbi:MAG: hypothetical protein AAFQ80_01510 [Cyanobacteria bacterium J06621_8]
MELVYRGIRYQNKKSEFPNLFADNRLPIFYGQKNIGKQTKCGFPLVKYCQQILLRQKPVILSPAKFWHQYQIQLLESCWQLDVVIMLNFCWQASIVIEMERSLRQYSYTELKYRGVTYYKRNMVNGVAKLKYPVARQHESEK